MSQTGNDPANPVAQACCATDAAELDFRLASFLERGWTRFESDASLLAWLHAALPHARAATRDPALREWLRCAGTWFVGVNALGNDTSGVVGRSTKLTGEAVSFVRDYVGVAFEWDAAQVSVCYPGYPARSAEETQSSFLFRRDRDAAHVDGLLPEGPQRRRHLREHHAFILGLPMVTASADAAPFVVWEGSHEIIRAALRERFAGISPEHWGEEDVTEVYQRSRRLVFESCRRVEVHAVPGEAYVAHRLVVHGMAPWGAHAESGPDGRMICYFRPELNDPSRWLCAP